MVNPTLHDTRSLVAKDPKETNNVVTLHLVPLSSRENTSWTDAQSNAWIDIQDKTLLTVLKDWYKEGRLPGDCKMHLTLANAVLICRYVDEERLKDYPEERQKQFMWQ